MPSRNLSNSEDQVKMTADLLDAMDSSLASQCLAFVNSTLSFPLDTIVERKVKLTMVKVKPFNPEEKCKKERSSSERNSTCLLFLSWIHQQISLLVQRL